MDTKKMALVVEYDGTSYHGFQLQVSVPTVQGEIEKALLRLTGERIRIACASRTDVGVHAEGQVVAFGTGSSLSPETFVGALNYYLPQDIAVRAALGVAHDFDVRRGALSREYRYHLLNSPTPSPLLRSRAYLVPRTLDIEAMNKACRALVGEHDFAPFASSLNGRRNTVRTVHQAGLAREGDLVTFYMVANSFLPHQVRNTIGALVKVGRGKSDAGDFWRIAQSKTPGLAGPALPPHGLCLEKVNYPNGAFK